MVDVVSSILAGTTKMQLAGSIPAVWSPEEQVRANGGFDSHADKEPWKDGCNKRWDSG